MSKILVKRVLWAIILVVAVLFSGFLLNAAGNLLGYFQRGADPALALNIVPNKPPDLFVRLTWQADPPDTGRKVEPFTRTEIETAYLRAWLQWNISFGKNAPYGLKTYFSGPALAALSENIQATAAKGWKILQADTSHDLQINFYASDGSIVSFTDHQALVTRMIQDSSGAIVQAGEDAATYDVVMMLEDGNWRIRHWLRTSGTTPAAEPALPLLQPHPGFVTRNGTGLSLDGQPYQIAGINYYPQATPWDKFWLNYNPAIIEKDLALMQSLKLNAVRIFIPFTQFGGPHLGETPVTQAITSTVTVADKTLVKDPLAKLDDFLAKADKHGLKVIVTLFDFRTDYSLLLWPQADRQLETLLTHYKDSATILAWDLKNEPDLDYRTNKRELVDAWLSHVSRMARVFDPYHLLTIGWSSPAAAQALTDRVDFVSFHYYAPAPELSKHYQALQAAAPGLPIAMTEFGVPTWNSFFFPGGHSEPEQAEYYADLLTFLRTNHSAGYMAWTLYDFSYVPSTVAGGLPWQNSSQKELGIVKADGKLKPAAQLLAPDANFQVTHIPGWARFLKPFWITVIILLVLSLLLVVKLVQRRRKKLLTSPEAEVLPEKLA
jgi:hypothetical protein